MAKYSIDSTTLTSIGDAIRAKEGSTGVIPVSDIPSRIAAIQTGADVSGVTAGEVDVVAGKIFVDASGAEKTGTLQRLKSQGELISQKQRALLQMRLRAVIFLSAFPLPVF